MLYSLQLTVHTFNSSQPLQYFVIGLFCLVAGFPVGVLGSYLVEGTHYRFRIIKKPASAKYSFYFWYFVPLAFLILYAIDFSNPEPLPNPFGLAMGVAFGCYTIWQKTVRGDWSVERRPANPQVIASIAWFVWGIHAFCALAFLYVPLVHIPLVNPEAAFQHPDFQQSLTLLVVGLIAVALTEVLITIALRHYALVRPARKGTFSPDRNPVRFLVVCIITWLISVAIVFYGAVIYYVSGDKWPLLLFGAIGLALLVFHSPRFSAFEKREAVHS